MSFMCTVRLTKYQEKNRGKKKVGQVLDQTLWTWSYEGQDICRPNIEGQVRVHKKCPGPGLDQTLDSLLIGGFWAAADGFNYH